MMIDSLKGLYTKLLTSNSVGNGAAFTRDCFHALSMERMAS